MTSFSGHPIGSELHHLAKGVGGHRNAFALPIVGSAGADAFAEDYDAEIADGFFNEDWADAKGISVPEGSNLPAHIKHPMESLAGLLEFRSLGYDFLERGKIPVSKKNCLGELEEIYRHGFTLHNTGTATFTGKISMRLFFLGGVVYERTIHVSCQPGEPLPEAANLIVELGLPIDAFEVEIDHTKYVGQANEDVVDMELRARHGIYGDRFDASHDDYESERRSRRFNPPQLAPHEFPS